MQRKVWNFVIGLQILLVSNGIILYTLPDTDMEKSYCSHFIIDMSSAVCENSGIKKRW